MYYFRFEIPRNGDGSIATYPQGWCGVMDRVPNNVTVLAYNDVVGFGIAQADDSFVPPEVTVLTEADALAQVASLADADGIYTGDKLLHRWDAPVVPDVVDGPGAAPAKPYMRSTITVKGLGICGACKKVCTFTAELPKNMKCSNIFLNGKCPRCGSPVKAKVF